MTKKQNRSCGFGVRTVSVILALLMVLSLIVVGLLATATAAGTKTITVGIVEHLSQTGYQVHYWNGSTSGDVNLTSTGRTEQKSVGSAYWNNSPQKFYMYTAQIPSDSTGIRVHCGDTWFGDDGNPAANNAAYVFEYGGVYRALYATVTDPTPDPTEPVDPTPTGDADYSAPVNASNSANSSGIFWADATYYDYLSDAEIDGTWLKPVHAGTKDFNGSVDEWYPFYILNRDLIKAVAGNNPGWEKPLYFGNFCNTYNAYDTGHHAGTSNGYNHATGSSFVTRFDYAANNSNGVYDRFTSVQGLMGSTLNNERQLQTPDGTVAPYFDANTLGEKARVIESKFPFRISDEGSYTRYEFDSTNAKDNVYFTWETSGGKTYPKYVNYGSGERYGVKDGIKDFMNTDSGYGIFPFNLSDSDNADTIYWGNRSSANTNSNLDYGFGIRMDMKFRVPDDQNVTFDFSGDDDLWMYITDETTKQSQLVLDMGGSHKMSEGYVNFTPDSGAFANAGISSAQNTGIATVKKVDDRNASNNDIWFMDQSSWGSMVMWAWDNSGNGEWYYAEQSSNLYRFHDNIIGSAGNPLSSKTKFKVAKNTNWEGESPEFNISDRTGKCSYTDNFNWTDTNNTTGGHCKTVSDSFEFHTNRTYTMTIFYMERGLIESNCKMGFTMTPLGNNFIVTEKINTTNVNKGLVDKVKGIDSFHFDLQGKNGNTVTKSRSFDLGNNGRREYSYVFDINSVVNAVQTKNTSSYLTYTTEWNYYDNENNKALLGSTNVNNPSTTNVTQPFINTATNDPYDFAEFQIDYINTPTVGSFSVEKVVDDDDPYADYSDETFPVKIYLKFSDSDLFTAYTLYDRTGQTVIANGGTVDLTPNQPVTFYGIPIGTKVYVAEQNVDPEVYTVSYSHSSGSPLIVNSNNNSNDDTITVTNTPVNPDAAFADISGVKKLDDVNYTGDLFTFNIEGMAPLTTGDIDTSGVNKTVDACANGAFKFSSLEYTEPGTYRYHVYEDMESLEDKGATYSSDIFGVDTEYLVTVTVTKSTDNQGHPILVPSNPVFVKYTPNPTAGITLADFNKTPVSAMEIKNFTQDCYIDIEKTNQAGRPVSGVQFAVYKLTDADVTAINAMTDEAAKYTYVTEKYTQPVVQTTNASGNTSFFDLSMYKDGYESSSAPEHQQYCVLEYGYTGDGVYAINKTVNIFSFPVFNEEQQPQYHMTFSYVNGAIKNPDAGISGVANVMHTGVALVVFSMVLLAAYVLFMKKKGYISVRFKK